MRPVLTQWRNHHALLEQGLHEGTIGGCPERGHGLLSEAVSSTKQFVTDIKSGMSLLALRRILNEVAHSALSVHQHDVAWSRVAVQSRHVIRASRRSGNHVSSEELQYRISPSRPKPAEIRPPRYLHRHSPKTCSGPASISPDPYPSPRAFASATPTSIGGRRRGGGFGRRLRRVKPGIILTISPPPACPPPAPHAPGP